MKVFSVLVSALAVAAFAAGMPTATDASMNIKSIKSNNNSESIKSSESSEDSEARRKKNWEELANPLLGIPQIDDPEAYNLTFNRSWFYETARTPIPDDSIRSPFTPYLEPNITKPEFKCLESNHWPWFPRMSWQFKGYCEDDYGQCFLKALRDRGAIVHNWQCWKRDDGWWQADYTHIHAYLAVIPVLEASLAQVIGFRPHCE